MKLVSYTLKKKDRLGIYVDGKVYDLEECAGRRSVHLQTDWERGDQFGD